MINYLAESCYLILVRHIVLSRRLSGKTRRDYSENLILVTRFDCDRVLDA